MKIPYAKTSWLFLVMLLFMGSVDAQDTLTYSGGGDINDNWYRKHIEITTAGGNTDLTTGVIANSSDALSLTVTTADGSAANSKLTTTVSLDFSGDGEISSGGTGTAELNITGVNTTVSFGGDLTIGALGKVSLANRGYLKANSVVIQAGGILEATRETNMSVDPSGELKLEAGGKLSVSGILVVGSSGGGVATANNAGLIEVTGSGSLVIDRLVNTGTVTVAENAYFRTAALAMSSGSITVQGEMVDMGNSTANISGGSVTVENTGTFAYNTLNLGGSARVEVDGLFQTGTVNLIGSGSSLNVRGTMENMAGTSLALSVSGGSALSISGTLKSTENISIDVSGAGSFDLSGTIEHTPYQTFTLRLTENATANFGTGVSFGPNNTVDTLVVDNNAKLTLATSMVAESLSGSGQITIRSDGSGGDGLLRVQSGGGSMNYVLDNGYLLFSPDTTISTGSISSINGNRGVVELANSLTIGSGGTLDASRGNLLFFDSENFTLTGTYVAGLDSSGATPSVFMASVQYNDTLTIGGDATVTMTGELIRNLSSLLDANNRVKIMDFDPLEPSSILDAPNDLQWTYDDWTYFYEVDGDGIYYAGSTTLNRAERRNNILENWRYHPNVDGHVGNVLKPDLIEAIINASDLVNGQFPGVDYNQLSDAGKFNASVLASLYSPKTDANGNTQVGYDSLMLYNGSGLAMVSTAVLSVNSAQMTRLQRRMSDLRGEIRATDVLDPDSWCPEPMRENRFWAEATWHSENSGRREGFSGYDYRGKGLTVGYDHMWGDLVVGGAINYMSGSFHDKAALGNQSDLDNYSFHLYSTLTCPSGLFASLLAGYGVSENNIKDFRILNGNSGYNRASYNTDVWMLAATVGHDFWLADFLTVTPSLGITYAHANSARHRQYFASTSGGVSANTLTTGDIKNSTAMIPVELAFSYDVLGDDDQLFSITGRVGYAYDFGHKGAKGKISYGGLTGILGQVGIASRDEGRHVFNAGFAGRYYYRNYEFGLMYDYTGRRKQNTHSLSLEAGISF